MEAAAPGPDAAAAAAAPPLPPPATVAELHELMRRLGECVGCSLQASAYCRGSRVCLQPATSLEVDEKFALVRSIGAECVQVR